MLPGIVDEIKVGFSHCGTSVAIFYPGRSWPELVPLSSASHESANTRQKRAIDNDDDDDDRPNKRLQPLDGDARCNTDSTVALSQLPPVLSTSSVLALQGENSALSGNIAILQSRSNPRQIEITYGTEENSRTLSICKFPDHIPLQSSTAKVTMSTNSDTKPGSLCTLVVNSESACVSVSDEPQAAEHLPLVVRKDVRSLDFSPISSRFIRPPR